MLGIHTGTFLLIIFRCEISLILRKWKLCCYGYTAAFPELSNVKEAQCLHVQCCDCWDCNVAAHSMHINTLCSLNNAASHRSAWLKQTLKLKKKKKKESAQICVWQRCENCSVSPRQCLVLTSQDPAHKIGLFLHLEIVFNITHHCQLKAKSNVLWKTLSKYCRQPSEIYSFALQVSD